MTDKEAMKQALEALEQIARLTGPRWALENSYAGHLEAITALREALAQPEQEPVAWFSPAGNLYKTRFHATANGEQVVTPLYTAPPQRTWVGLTKQQQIDIFAQSVAKKRSEHEHYIAIEQALKERNR